MSDVSVVLLTVGEATTGQAIESVRRQTVPPAEVIEVRDVRPFHVAMNTGVARVRTPFLLQVDADMVLDPNCIEVLRAAMQVEPATGVAVAFLRDALVGRVSGVKMFRRACLEGRPFGEGVSPDTDLIDAMRQSGWRDVYILEHGSTNRETWHTLGAHVPPYEDRRYTYAKYLLEGARYRHRGDVDGLRWHLGVLHRSRHESAPVARIALLNGALMMGEEDLMDRERPLSGFAALEAFMSSRNEHSASASPLGLYLSSRPTALFRRYHALGGALRRAGAYPTFERISERLARSGDRSYWIALAGLYRGACTLGERGPGAVTACDADTERLRPLLPSPVQLLIGKAGDLVRVLRRV